MSFSTLGLDPTLTQRLDELEYQQPTDIQAAAIPLMLAGEDVMAGAQTGTGKTAAFVLPILQRLIAAKNESLTHSDNTKTPGSDSQINATSSGVKALILVPTRELAQQVHQSVVQYAEHTDISAVMVYGGVSIKAQVTSIQAGVDIIIATPGRLLDHLRNKVMSLSSLQYLVLDEADRMLDMGFKEEIVEVLKRLPKQRQTALFSATLDDQIFRFSQRLLRSPKIVETAKRNSTAAKIIEKVYNLDSERKSALLGHIVNKEPWSQTLVFSRTKQGADKIAAQLTANKISAAPFHADLSQFVRESTLADFKAGKVKVLVATDVAARGLDIEQLDAVVNFELPFKAEDYVHRIGRTGRAGKDGVAVTFLSPDDEALLVALERKLDRRLPQQWYQGFEPDLTKEPALQPRKAKKGSLKQRARQKAIADSARKRK
ncbi:DEAD/DEAH box helicase [Shewanella olleyana]|uniref:DEAD/DEAH box helicase n=1 Tax=Shewanella olleyana TaxID=135626 RepID=UPI00200FBA79|nr:DEAD/DEAH box helicase [Shewanella olleyana]MCL1066054.1 DEAD/DEAH box helicase [Shewanella olleyana]